MQLFGGKAATFFSNVPNHILDHCLFEVKPIKLGLTPWSGIMLACTVAAAKAIRTNWNKIKNIKYFLIITREICVIESILSIQLISGI